MTTFSCSACLLLCASLVMHLVAASYEYPFQNPALSWEDRVNDLVSRLTIDEKVAQMSHGGAELNGPAPAISRLGIKPYQWGTECLRGDVDAGAATSFPQALGFASAFSQPNLFAMAQATSDEVRAKNNNYSAHGNYSFHTGLSCWSPVINIFRDPRWGRGQETYGEDPYLSGMLAHSYVTGLQGSDARYFEAIAGCKHFDAYAGPEDIPVDRFKFDAIVSMRDWRTTFLPAFKACVEAGAFSIMCSYNEINGVPACANNQLLGDILRTEWAFPGYVVSDQGALEIIKDGHNYTTSYLEAAVVAANAGTDLEDGNQAINVFSLLTEANAQGLASDAVINASVSRLFMARMRLGEFDPPSMNPYTTLNVSTVVNSPLHWQLSEDSAVRSFALLKNEKQVLPMNRSGNYRLGILGCHANTSSYLYGDYSPNSAFTVTPLQGIESALAKSQVEILYEPGCASVFCPQETYDGASVNKTCSAVDLALVFLGLSPDIESEGNDRSNISFPGNQLQLLQDCAAQGTTVVLVIFNAGPLDLNWANDNVAAILAAFYPAQSTGTALARVLFGSDSPAGRLPVTYIKSLDTFPAMTNYSMDGRTYRYIDPAEVLFPFGFGLSYSTFSYSALQLSATALDACDPLMVTVNVSNTGKVTSDEVVQVYLSWNTTEVPSPIRQLCGFARATLTAGNTTQLSFNINAEQRALWSDTDNAFMLVPQTFFITVGGQQPGQIVSAPSNILSGQFATSPPQIPLSQCA